MNKRICFILIPFLPICAFSQSFSQPDSIKQRIVHEDCDDKVFTKVEILPSLKKGVKNFEDTLAFYLKKHNLFKNNTHVTFKFLLTKSCHVFGIKKEGGDFEDESILNEFMTSNSFMWKPAVQNGRLVCAYVLIEIEISNEKLSVAIKQ